VKLAALIAIAATLIANAAPAQAPWPGVVILMYHKVNAVTPGDAVGRSLTIEPAVFEAQLASLRRRNIRTLTTRELAQALSRGEPPANSVVLTFDDGYEDAFTEALPLLRKYGAKASFYVSADFVGTPRHLTWRELREMRDAGMEIGCHGSRHLDLATIPIAQKQYEIGHCASALHQWLGIAPKSYAYAAGQYDAAALTIARSNGFIAGLTEHPGVVRDFARPLELPRRRVDRDDSLAAFDRFSVP
jgi:peptidoglycan/xylan/chitin deacetylase (PgdA/CDA1 family)